MRVTTIRPRGTPKDPPPELPKRAPGEVKVPSAFPDDAVPFTSLGLPEGILQSLTEMGYTTATSVQAASIPKARTGVDLLVQSRTGTGKTAAFGIPIVEKTDTTKKQVQALILCPTRELCVQVAGEMARLGAGHGVQALAIYGGDSMTRQLEGLQKGAQVVVGTPGRLLDHLRQGTLKLEAVKTLVLDEADQMLDMGFERELNAILAMVPKERQTMMFSATIPSSIEGIAARHQKNPERLMLSQDVLYVTDVLHLFYIVPKMGKTASLHKLIEWENPSSSMIFCNTKAETRLVHGYLAMHGLPAAMISSDLPQKKREQVMRRFRNKELKHLVATDVAARGIDIEDLSHVFIFSTPESSDQYIHRAGRTGRIGKTGKAISLVSGFDLMNFNRLVRANNLKAYECDLPSDDEVRQREVKRIVETLKDQAAKLTAEDRTEYDPMAQGILDQEERLAIVAYLLKTHFIEEAARSVLDEVAADEEVGLPAEGIPGQGGLGAPGGDRGHRGARQGRSGGGRRHEGGGRRSEGGHAGGGRSGGGQSGGGHSAGAPPGGGQADGNRSESAPAVRAEGAAAPSGGGSPEAGQGARPQGEGVSSARRRRRRGRRGGGGGGGGGGRGGGGGGQGGGGRSGGGGTGYRETPSGYSGGGGY
jgi:ATP-dependent RNA helicase DeaD